MRGVLFFSKDKIRSAKKVMKNPFKVLNKFDITLWCVSVIAIITSFMLSPRRDYFTLFSSITGVSSLIFIVKGNVFGQILMVIFAVLYGVVSYFFKYYGEMITYLGMSAPAAVFSIVAWLRHPYKQSSHIEINRATPKALALVATLAAAVTVAFYFILRAIGTNNLAVSTVSVLTSCLAALLAFLRSPLYGLAYATNDIVLIVLWVLATIADVSYLPMIICFSLFLIFDTYGFINWRRMRKAQIDEEAKQETDVQTNAHETRA